MANVGMFSHILTVLNRQCAGLKGLAIGGYLGILELHKVFFRG